jgi:phosphoglycolate phosphatase-like HAD superfamily hydrolase
VNEFLALFDVDGTLFLTHDPLSSRALLETLRERYPVDPPDDAVEHVDHAGQTAKRIARLVLQAQRLPDSAIEQRLDEWCEAFGERYVELLAGADTSGWRVGPGGEDALARLARGGVRLALLTGNPELMARARMLLLGLDRFFPQGQGAFGCDAEERTALIDLARERAGGWPAGRTVEVGDTLRDSETARAAGVRSIVVGSSGTGNLEQAAETILAWNGRS